MRDRERNTLQIFLKKSGISKNHLTRFTTQTASLTIGVMPVGVHRRLRGHPPYRPVLEVPMYRIGQRGFI